MSYLVLARKWRPRKFSEVKGQPHAVRALTNAISAERVHHAWLFAGTRGVGKTTLARILAAALNCQRGAAPEPCGECESCRSIEAGSFVDLMEVDAASRTKVEQTRELLENVQYVPASGSYKIYLIDEAHMLSASSFNALLKTLEEPPPHVKFLLATTEPRRLPVTVLSRCLQINLRSMDADTISDQLAAICEGEGIEAEPGALVRLARAANGSMRDALSLLDQAIAYGADAVRETDVADMLGGADQPSIIHLLNALAAGDGEALLGGARELRERLADPANILAEMAAALQRLALLQGVGEGALHEDDESELLAPLAAALPADQVQLLYEIAIQGRSKLPLAPDPGLGLEMALLRMLAFQPESASRTVQKDATASPAPVKDTVAVVRTGRAESHGAGRSQSTAPSRETEPAPRGDRCAVAEREEEREAVAGRSAPDTAAALPAPDSDEDAQADGPAPTPAGNEALSSIQWPETVARLGLEGLVGQLAAHSELKDARNGCIKINLDGAHENLLTDEARDELSSALLKALPAFQKVEIENAGAGKGDTLAARNRAAERRRQQRAEEEFQADPFVQASLEIFGAKVEVGSVRPTDSPEDQTEEPASTAEHLQSRA